MASITNLDLETLFTTLYVLVDDWYQTTGQALLAGKAGAKPIFSDSELLTLLLAHDFVPYPGETQYIAYIRANHLALFPKLVDQSQYNRRGRNLRKRQVSEREVSQGNFEVCFDLVLYESVPLINCPHCQSANIIQYKKRTSLSYRVFRCHCCKAMFNERTGTAFNAAQFPTDIVL